MPRQYLASLEAGQGIGEPKNYLINWGVTMNFLWLNLKVDR